LENANLQFAFRISHLHFADSIGGFPQEAEGREIRLTDWNRCPKLVSGG
jgi:hypothetical protein